MWNRPAIRWTSLSFLCSLLLLLAVGGSSPAAAATLPPVATATATLDVQIHAGFDGFYKAGGWLPVTAVARNDGPPLDGKLELAAGIPASLFGHYSAAAVLPTHSQKRLSFAAPAPAAANNRTVTLSAGGRTLLTQSVPMTALSPQDYLYGVISPNAGALDALRGLRQFGGTVSIAHLSLADIPTSGPALNDVDALVIDNTTTAALTSAQRAILAGWISGGGQLVLAGGSGAAQTLAGLTDLAPVTLTGSTVLDVGAALAPWTHAAQPDSTTVAVSRPAAGSAVRLAVGGIPLVVDRAVGQGWVTFLAMSAATPTLHNGPGGARAWQQILSGGRHPLDGAQTNVQPGSLAQSSAVYALPQTVLPSGTLLFWLLFGYILVVGPVNYLLLRSSGHRELLWLTIPLISLLFSGGAYLLARQIKGSDIVVNTVTVARHSPGTAPQSAATIDGAVGIFSPGRTTYNMRIDGGLGITALAAPGSSSEQSALTVLSEGSSSLIQDIRVQKWSLQAFAVHGYGMAKVAQLPIDASLSLTGSTVSGWIRNRGVETLQDVVLVIGGDSTMVADMAPGEQRSVRLVLSGSVAPVSGFPSRPITALGGGNSSAERRNRALLQSLMTNGLQGQTAPAALGGPQVLAFSASAPFAVDVLGHQVQQHNTTLHILPVAVGLPVGTSTLPYGFAQREMLENSGVTNQVGGPWLPLGSTAVFQLQLPANAGGRQWSTLHVRLNFTNYGRALPAAGAGSTSVALYNWGTGTWDVQAGFTQGVQTLQQAARYVDLRGLIRVQITGANGQEQLQTLDVALDGGPARTAGSASIAGGLQTLNGGTP